MVNASWYATGVPYPQHHSQICSVPDTGLPALMCLIEVQYMVLYNVDLPWQDETLQKNPIVFSGMSDQIEHIERK